MGKNEGHKAAQALKAAGNDDPVPGSDAADGYDATFHTPAWHEARMAALQEPARPTLDEFKERKAEDDERAAVLKEVTDKADREYRQAMDKERARILSGGRPGDSGKDKKERREKDKKDKKDKKKKHKKEGKEKSSSKSSKSSSSKRKRHDSSSGSEGPSPKHR